MILWPHIYTIAWAAVTAILILLPGSQMPDTGGLVGFDKVAHFGVFALLSLLAIIGSYKHKRIANKRFNATFAAVVSCIVYSILLEGAQLLIPDRQFDALDMVANISGIAGGAIIFLIIYKL